MRFLTFLTYSTPLNHLLVHIRPPPRSLHLGQHALTVDVSSQEAVVVFVHDERAQSERYDQLTLPVLVHAVQHAQIVDHELALPHCRRYGSFHILSRHTCANGAIERSDLLTIFLQLRRGLNAPVGAVLLLIAAKVGGEHSKRLRFLFS